MLHTYLPVVTTVCHCFGAQNKTAAPCVPEYHPSGRPTAASRVLPTVGGIPLWILKMHGFCICHLLWVQARGWRALDTWADIPVGTDQSPEAPGLPGDDGRQKLPVSASATMKFTLNYKAYDNSESLRLQTRTVRVRNKACPSAVA